ncbi:hypothetical protein D3C74_417320 [compost metagenome]
MMINRLGIPRYLKLGSFIPGLLIYLRVFLSCSTVTLLRSLGREPSTSSLEITLLKRPTKVGKSAMAINVPSEDASIIIRK